ncbi:MAG TPA: hypothetical protein VFP35_02230 [Candidatus Saccharimonadales bacterium]|nr:hypothetical protein [Candidatus Saccharimonadales bacterium]
MRLANRRYLLILGCSLLILLIVIAALLAFRNQPKVPGKNSLSQHVDTFSGETVSNPKGVAPEKYGVSPNTPVYLGFDKLLNYGLTDIQLNLVKLAFYKYSQSLAKPLGQISVGANTITTQHDPTNPNSNFNILFKVQFDEKAIYQANVEYAGLNDARLIITTQSGNKEYDSGTLDSN